MTSSLPTATTTLNSTTAVTVLVSSVIGATLIVIMILLTITVTIWCIIIRKRKTTEGIYTIVIAVIIIKLSTEKVPLLIIQPMDKVHKHAIFLQFFK